MRILRRVIFPILWLVLFSIIAAALVKMAFIDGLKDEGQLPVPQAQVQAPVIEAGRATVTNTVDLAGTVQSDAAVPVRATAAGKVVFFFVEKGATVGAGEPLFQVRREVVPDPAGAPDASADKGGADAEGAMAAVPALAAPVYSYTDILSPAAGTLDTLSVLLNQEVSVGDQAGTIAPGTFSITGSLSTAQQFRLMGKPATATGTIPNGPAPFACQDVQLSNKAATEDAGVGAASIPGGTGGPAPADTGTGQVSCAVPVGTTVFPGLGATITLTAGEAKDVLTLPLTAVKGSVQNGLVWIPSADGASAPEERKVLLGLNDGKVVEIISGLDEGQQVLEFVPGVDAPMPDGQMAGFGPMGG